MTRRMIKKRIKTCCNVVTLYATLNDKTTTTAWDTMPRSEKDGWKWESLPTALEAHCSNVMTQNLFNTYKYKMLKKMVVSFRQIARAYDVIQNYSIVGDTTKNVQPTAKMSTQATTLMASRDLSFCVEKAANTGTYLQTIIEEKLIERSRINVNSKNRLIIVHAGSSTGFIPGAQLIYKASTKTGDYHGQMNYENFEKWVLEKLIPNLRPKSVVCMDNAPYHTKVANPTPTKYSTKKEMTDWLINNGIECDMKMRKAELIFAN
ncbi:hypothetical protein HNY73_014441 [Argiope bruennichi]|uniref:Tc1-like transposase DDE domain-containing protein n=1 Tax=Argiope bruennichi TaxID=94029 RepID=A0A8T0EP85_ARGBR|nr:hypothetical protein HNY73_014441 [Argiope bruennichi]